jgi:hypothetical protein
MRAWTYLEIKEKVQNDLDLEDEIFITAEEMLGYVNEAIDNAEAQIHALYEDYFLTKDTLALVTNTATYSMPTDIYANKIRSIYYVNGSIKYPVMKWKQPLYLIPFVETNDDYQYLPINTSANGYQMQLIPASQETSAANITRWYIRNAKVLVDDDDVCDIPEFINYILQYTKMRCYEKEGHVTTLKAIDDTEKEKQLMIQTLTNMVDDEDTELRKDFSFYQDFDSDWGF